MEAFGMLILMYIMAMSNLIVLTTGDSIELTNHAEEQQSNVSLQNIP